MKTAWLSTLTLVFAGFAFAQAPYNKIASDVQNVDPKSTVNVIVQFDQVPTEAHHNLVRARGGSLRRTLNLVKAGSYRLPASAVADLANEPSVVHISVDHPLTSKLDYTTAATNATVAWKSGWTGSGIGVAVIDSGISSSQDFSSGNLLGMPSDRELFTARTSPVALAATLRTWNARCRYHCRKRHELLRLHDHADAERHGSGRESDRFACH